MPLDNEAVRGSCRDSVVIEGRQFCRAELERFRKAAAGGDPMSMAISGNFLYAANAGSSDVSAYAMDRTTGALASLGGTVGSSARSGCVVGDQCLSGTCLMLHCQ